MNAARSPVQTHIEAAGAVAVVLGPCMGDGVAAEIEGLGAGWSSGVQLWRQAGLDYALLLAVNRRRVRERAPLLLLARDLDALLYSVTEACVEMKGRTCLWLVLDTGQAGDAVQRVLADDMATAGNA
jgi:hypothetical protein